MVKEEKILLESNNHEDDDYQSLLTDQNKGRQERHVKEEGSESKPSSPTGKDTTIAKQVSSVNINEKSMDIDVKNGDSAMKNEEEQLKSARAEMGEVREENERLKSLLAQIMKDYQSLHTHFLEVLQQEATKKSADTVPSTHDHDHLGNDEEPELVSLSLGRRSSEPRKDIGNKKESNLSTKDDHNKDQDDNLNERLKLGLDCRFDQGNNSTETTKNNSSCGNSLEEPKELEEQEPIETWPPSKILKTARSGDEDEVLEQSHLKKARVSIRARCDTPTMNDGCQWRKYGQKIAKGNPCPRAYYRCTVSPTCPVRKQVQRCAEDMSILITTYEGTHNHPLPISATAMASTTSAAASMLNSRSSTSQPGGLGTSTSANLHGLNFTLPQNSSSYFPHSSITTSNSHPTITLDLTTPATFSNFNRFSSAVLPRSSTPSCLSFSSSSSEAIHQTPWSNPTGYFNYGSTVANFNRHNITGSLSSSLHEHFNRNNTIGSSLSSSLHEHFNRYNIIGSSSSSLSIGRQQPHEHFYQPYMSNQNQNQNHSQSLTETIAAATKAITSNPTFRSALTAALTSYVGNGVQENQGGAQVQSLSGFPFAQSGSSSSGCASSFLNKSSSLSNNHHQQQQQGSLVLFPPSLQPLSGSKSSATTGSGSPPDDNRDHVK